MIESGWTGWRLRRRRSCPSTGSPAFIRPRIWTDGVARFCGWFSRKVDEHVHGAPQKISKIGDRTTPILAGIDKSEASVAAGPGTCRIACTRTNHAKFRMETLHMVHVRVRSGTHQYQKIMAAYILSGSTPNAGHALRLRNHWRQKGAPMLMQQMVRISR